MLIQELSRQASLDLLARTRLGRLARTQEAQPYVVPVHFAYDDNALYSFATVGQKIEWMRANPLVCVEVDEVVGQQQWVSVIVFGRYEELPVRVAGGARSRPQASAEDRHVVGASIR